MCFLLQNGTLHRNSGSKPVDGLKGQKLSSPGIEGDRCNRLDGVVATANGL